MENMGEKLCKRLHSHRLNPLNNARFPMSYAVLNLTFLRFVRYSTKDFPDLNIYIIFKYETNYSGVMVETNDWVI